MRTPSTTRFFRIYRLLLALTFLLAAGLSWAQTTPQIAKETAARSNSTFLLGFYPTASKTQSLYLPADLAGAAAGNITRLYFMYGSTGIALGNTLTNLTIKLGQTPAPAFAGRSFFADSDFTTVLQAPSYSIAPGVSGEWFSIPLTASFVYDPTQTLILQITFTGSATTTFGTFGSTNNGKKLYADTPDATTGDLSSGTWQHFGFDLGAALATRPPASATTVRCFPNPATQQLTVVLSETTEPTTLTLTDAVGRVVLRHEALAATLRTGSTLDVRALPPGPYALTVAQRGRQTIRRIVVQ